MVKGGGWEAEEVGREVSWGRGERGLGEGGNGCGGICIIRRTRLELVGVLDVVTRHSFLIRLFGVRFWGGAFSRGVSGDVTTSSSLCLLL